MCDVIYFRFLYKIPNLLYIVRSNYERICRVCLQSTCQNISFRKGLSKVMDCLTQWFLEIIICSCCEIKSNLIRSQIFHIAPWPFRKYPVAPLGTMTSRLGTSGMENSKTNNTRDKGELINTTLMVLIMIRTLTTMMLRTVTVKMSIT